MYVYFQRAHVHIYVYTCTNLPKIFIYIWFLQFWQIAESAILADCTTIITRCANSGIVARGVAIQISQSMSQMGSDLRGVGVSCEACRRSINDYYFFLWGLMQRKSETILCVHIYRRVNTVDQQVFLICFLWVQTLKWYTGFNNIIALVLYSRRYHLSTPRVANWDHPCLWRTFQPDLTKGCTVLHGDLRLVWERELRLTTILLFCIRGIKPSAAARHSDRTDSLRTFQKMGVKKKPV